MPYYRTPEQKEAIRAAAEMRKAERKEFAERVVEMRGDLVLHGEIASAAKPWHGRVCGVYFLLCKGVVVYVGQSVGVHARVDQHEMAGLIAFDAWHYVECEQEQLDVTERAYIDALLPVMNRDDRTLISQGLPVQRLGWRKPLDVRITR
jgi:hypothetical protein